MASHNADDSDGVTVMVLAGGRSTRMGRDKPTCVELVESVERVFPKDRIFVSLGAGQPISDDLDRQLRGIAVVRDRSEASHNGVGVGPLGGIQAGLSRCQTPWLMVLPCDCPFVSESFIRGITRLTHGTQSKVIVPKPDSDLYEPLHALYSRELLPQVDSMVATNHRRVYDLFDVSCTTFVDRPMLDSIDSAWESSFFNINTPSQLEAAQAHVASNFTSKLPPSYH
ncbi:molybdenum cofactor guanylyltransferase [Pelomyxa schiedti]|nr:molybdenum cofactor guanylyltransferase [Pelomyxa schiedti]